jgi:archaemetzincin
MNAIRLLATPDVDGERLETLGRSLRRTFGIPALVLTGRLDPSPTWHPERQQYHSSEMLAAVSRSDPGGDGPLLAVTGVDLYIPILTFVFGEAQHPGRYGLVSYHRLRQEFYGLPPDDAELDRRILKEAVHELGHTLGLAHCDDYSCVMASSHSVEWIDLKEPAFCESCGRKAVDLRRAARC